MDRNRIFILALIASLSFESSLISLPLVFPISLAYYFSYSTTQTVLISSAFGFLSDILNVSVMGKTPLAILVLCLFIDLYKRAFDVRDFRLVVFVILIATYMYAKLIW